MKDKLLGGLLVAACTVITLFFTVYAPLQTHIKEWMGW